MILCPTADPAHRHDGLCDPALAVPVRPLPPYDGHRAFMVAVDQDGWLQRLFAKADKMRATQQKKVARKRTPGRTPQPPKPHRTVGPAK